MAVRMTAFAGSRSKLTKALYDSAASLDRAFCDDLATRLINGGHVPIIDPDDPLRIERVAAALYENRCCDVSWHAAPSETKGVYRQHARVALDAAVTQ
jgi:hypothetical protein